MPCGPNSAGRVGGFGPWVPLGFLGAMIAAGLVALVVGLPTLRSREDYLAIATFGIAVTIQLVALNFETLTGGTHAASRSRARSPACSSIACTRTASSWR